jgi:hypothetical protein
MEHDSGAVTGSRYVVQADGSTDYRLRVGLDTLLDNDVFNYATQNSGRHSYANTTMTITWGSGFLTTNATAITTLNTGVKFWTYKLFPLYGATDVWFEFTGAFVGTFAPSNTTIDIGGFIPGASNPYAPTDGVYFRMNSAGMFGVLNYNGSEVTTSAFKASFGGADWAPVIGQVYKFGISVNNAEVEFWINDTLMAELDVPSSNGQPVSCGAVPFAIRHAITTAASASVQFKLADYTITLADLQTAKDWSHVNCGMGLCGYQGQSGGAMGSTASLANSSTPAGGAGSNTTALVTGLGGVGQMNAAAGAATDLIATSFQVPAGTAAYTGRTLYITGVMISAMNNGAAVATTPTSLMWSLCFGHTAVSLATGEASTTKAPRRIALGFQTVPVGAVVGQTYTPSFIWMPFASPVVVNPGEFVATVVRQIVGTATASQTILFNVAFDCYYE